HILLAAAGAGDALAADEMTVFDHDFSPCFGDGPFSAFEGRMATRGRTQPLCGNWTTTAGCALIAANDELP
ncbi:hypothetical protein, partial [Shinella sp.]|uniref:hypothetical protein n=1 Tax=Shinella sp. TaxID=1870904 RepID=UPI003F71C370